MNSKMLFHPPLRFKELDPKKRGKEKAGSFKNVVVLVNIENMLDVKK